METLGLFVTAFLIALIISRVFLTILRDWPRTPRTILANGLSLILMVLVALVTAPDMAAGVGVILFCVLAQAVVAAADIARLVWKGHSDSSWTTATHQPRLWPHP